MFLSTYEIFLIQYADLISLGEYNEDYKRIDQASWDKLSKTRDNRLSPES